MREQAQPTQFGETTLTETREGADRGRGIALHATQYGETTVTATREGLDQTDRAIQASQLGETTFTRTREGADQSEAPAVQASQLGETTLTKTREGADQSEGATLPVFMLLILTSDKDLTADFLIVELINRHLPYFRLNAEELTSADFTFSLTKEGPPRRLLWAQEHWT